MNRLNKELFIICSVAALCFLHGCVAEQVNDTEFRITRSDYTFEEIDKLAKTKWKTSELKIPKRKTKFSSEEKNKSAKMFTGETPYDQIDTSLLNTSHKYFLYHFAKTNTVLNAGDPYKGGFEYRFKPITIGPAAIRVYKDKNSIARIIGYYFHNDEEDYGIYELVFNIPGKVIHKSIRPSQNSGYIVFKHKEHLIMVGYYDKDYFFSLEIDPSIAKFEEPEHGISLN